MSGLVINEFKMSPLSGDVFVFISKPRNKIKILHWQGDGFVIYSKRLEKGTFELPKLNSITASMEISSDQLQFILSGIFLSSIQKRKRYEHKNVDKNAAMFYSSLGTCKVKGIEPCEWLKNLFEILPDWKANRLDELLP